MGRNLVFWLAIALVLFFLLNIFQGVQSEAGRGKELSYSEFMAGARDGSIRDVTIKGNELRGALSADGAAFRVVVPPNENVVDRLGDTGVEIKA
ncbi:MAG: ATP-dependent metallopeptidase FtsH/Yme1/Tma family protein, partial [Bdellovibrionales bacterium]